ncbi:hypothetical protein AAVH_13808 [Aphelenchoides avenae]|nr:hypothetical protein AAVH_13808 [Aphelenchus avenae]
MARTINWKDFPLVKTDGSCVNPATALKGKHVGLYFGAYSCAPSREFTRRLRHFYDAVKKANNFQVVVVPCDASIEEMNVSAKHCHADWLQTVCTKYQSDKLYAKYNCSGGIPDLIIFDEKGVRLPIRGCQEVDTCILPPAPMDVLDTWRIRRNDYFQRHRELNDVYTLMPLNVLEGFPSTSKMLVLPASQQSCKPAITDWKQLPLMKNHRYLNGAEALRGKLVGLFFSRWSAMGRQFTPELKQFYDAAHKTDNFEIVFVSRDNTAEEMKTFMKESHGDWVHVPFDKATANALYAKYSWRSGDTDLVIFDEKGDRLPIDGGDEVHTWAMRLAPKDVVAVWRTKAAIPRSVSDPVAGTINWQDCRLAKRDGIVVPPEVALQGKFVGLYFSARRCSDFGLKRFYESLTKAENFEVVFVSDDRSAEEMKANMEETQPDWLNIPFDKDLAHALFLKYGRSAGIPALVLFDPKGNLLPINGRNDVFLSAPPPKDLVAKWRTKRTNYYQY